MRKAAVDRLQEMLRCFVRGGDRSVNFAGEIGATFDELFPEDERFVELVIALASYRPGGGEFLYDETRILPLCRWALEEIESDLKPGEERGN